MNKLPHISEAEYEVMKIVWKHAPINTNEVTELLIQTTSWNPKTIHTLLKRLVQKGALSYEKKSRVYVYTPSINEEEYLEQASSNFLKRFYDGNLSTMLTSYLVHDKLSDTEIKELRDLLQQKPKKGEE